MSKHRNKFPEKNALFKGPQLYIKLFRKILYGPPVLNYLVPLNKTSQDRALGEPLLTELPWLKLTK